MTDRPKPFGNFAATLTASPVKVYILIDLSIKRLPQLIWNSIFVKQAMVNMQLALGPRPHSYLMHMDAGLILGLCPANERRRYLVTTSLIGWVQA